MKKPNYAPVYIGLYPDLAEICRKHGYALAVHGSVARDFDLVAVPWTDSAGDPQDVVDEITAAYAFKQAGGERSIREHGRIVYTLIVSFGECFLDFSFMPRANRAMEVGSV